jgi:hypothetical protein
VNDGEFKKFCWFEPKSSRIKGEERSEIFDDKKPKIPEGVLGF